MRSLKTLALSLLLTCSTLFGASFNTSFTAINQSLGPLFLQAKQSMTYDLSSFGSATILLQRNVSSGTDAWITLGTFTADQASTVYVNSTEKAQRIRFFVAEYSSGTIVANLADVDGDIVETIHVNRYGKAVVEIDDQDRLVFSGGTSQGSSLVLNAGAAGTGSIFHSDDDGLSQICGGDDAVSGGCLKLYGASHATLAGDFVLTDAAGASVLTHDDSAGSLTSAASVSVILSAGPMLVLEDSGTFGASADPHMTFRDGSGLGAVLGYNNAASDDFVVDNRRASGGTLIQHNSITRVEADSTGLGFFAATPVAQQTANAALTDSSGGTPDDTIAAVPAVNGSGATTAQEAAINDNFADVAEELNAIRTLLVNYGLGS